MLFKNGSRPLTPVSFYIQLRVGGKLFWLAWPVWAWHSSGQLRGALGPSTTLRVHTLALLSMTHLHHGSYLLSKSSDGLHLGSTWLQKAAHLFRLLHFTTICVTPFQRILSQTDAQLHHIC